MSNPSDREDRTDNKMYLRNLLHKIETATTDNEKLAGLLLFTHFMKANPALKVDSKELFKAIDVTFVVRLFNSVNVPDRCPDFMYKSLALNILSSFCPEGDILFHPLLISSLTSITEVLLVDRNLAETAQMFDDTVAILLAFSGNADGCKHLIDSNCIPIICNAIIQNTEIDKLFEILKGVILSLPQYSWAQDDSILLTVLELFAHQFAVNQDLVKFETCDKLLHLTASLCASKLDVSSNELFKLKWKDEIRNGLSDILQSRCKVEYKHTALQLTVLMMELLGIEWTVNSEQKGVLDVADSKFLLLVLSIVKTETRMILESDEDNEILCKLECCYAIIEKTIKFLVNDRQQSWSFSAETILKIHSFLTQTFDCIIQFLILLGSKETAGQTPCFERPVTIATVQILCLWLSEETNALSDKVSQVLPYLLKWAKFGQNNTASKDDLPSDGPSSILLYLLPPLCHLSADESFLAILIKEECHVLLANLFKQLWQLLQAGTLKHPSKLETLCSVLLNFSVLEVELIKTSEVFQEILECILLSIPQVVDSLFMTLTANFILLGLMLFRHKCQLQKTQLRVTENNFIFNSIRFLKQVCVSVTAEENSCPWNEISELWFLSVQNLVACARTIPPVKSVVLDSGWPKEVQQWVRNCDIESKNSLTQELKSALVPVANLE